MSFLGRAEAARARFYGALADSVDAGLPIAQALALAGETERGLAPAVADAAARLAEGATLSQALAPSGRFRAIEIEGLAAGEHSGRLLDVLTRLERRFGGLAQALERLHAGFIYPVALLHAAVLLPKLSVLILGTTSRYLAAVLPPLLGLYAVATIGWLLARTISRVPSLRAARDRILLALPLIGRWVRAGASADLGDVLALLVAAGIPLREALERSAGAIDNAALAAAARRAGTRIGAEGCPLAEALEPEGALLAPVLIAAVRAGEQAGKLDEALDRAARALRADAERALSVLVKLLPIVVYLGVAGYIAWVVVSAYANIYRSLPVL